MRKVTADQVKKSVMENNITKITHHDCAICGVNTFYYVDGQSLFYSSSCGCAASQARRVGWEAAADFINQQVFPKAQQEIATRFGLPAAIVKVIK